MENPQPKQSLKCLQSEDL